MQNSLQANNLDPLNLEKMDILSYLLCREKDAKMLERCERGN